MALLKCPRFDTKYWTGPTIRRGHMADVIPLNNQRRCDLSTVRRWNLPVRRTFRNLLYLGNRNPRCSSDPFFLRLVFSAMRMNNSKNHQSSPVPFFFSRPYRDIEWFIKDINRCLDEMWIQINETIILKAENVHRMARTSPDNSNSLR